jgi:hypothetical protein
MLLRFALSAAMAAACLCTAAAPAAAVSQDLGWGPTHASWERQALRSTVRFKDLTVTSFRNPDGAVEASLTGDDGAVLATLDLDAATLRMKTRQPGEPDWFSSTDIPYAAAEAPVLDWINLQLYSWWRDVQEIRTAPEHGKAARWTADDAVEDQGYFRPGPLRRAGQHADGISRRMLAAELEYGTEVARSRATESGFVTYLLEKTRPNRRADAESAAGRDAGREKLLAILIWQEDRQTLAFSFGESAPETRQFYELPGTDLPLGFFPFEPTMSWANVQILQTWLERLRQEGSVFEKDDPGCNGLHWLDNSSLRPCCDVHDNCYRARAIFTGAPCNAMSWFWPHCGSNPGCTWSCQVCNIQVITCFGINLIRHHPRTPDELYLGIWWSWHWSPYCHLDFPGYCPPECAWCL